MNFDPCIYLVSVFAIIILDILPLPPRKQKFSILKQFFCSVFKRYLGRPFKVQVQFLNDLSKNNCALIEQKIRFTIAFKFIIEKGR